MRRNREETAQRLVLATVDPYVDRDVLARQIAREEEQAPGGGWPVGWTGAGRREQKFEQVIGSGHAADS